MPENPQDSVAQHLGRLYRSIRWLGILMALNCVLLTALIIMEMSNRNPVVSIPAGDASTGPVTIDVPIFDPGKATAKMQVQPYKDGFSDFHDWPMEKQIREASVIIITKNVKRDGKWVGVVDKILKKDPGASFHYKVGDVYDHNAHRHSDPNVAVPKGMIKFFAGDLQIMRYGLTYYEEGGDTRIPGMNDLPLEQFQQLVQEQQKSGNQ